MMNDSPSINLPQLQSVETMLSLQTNSIMRLIQSMKKIGILMNFMYRVVLGDIINLMMLPIDSQKSTSNDIRLQIQAMKELQFLREGIFDLHNYIACSHHYTTTVSYTLVLIHDFVHDL